MTKVLTVVYFLFGCYISNAQENVESLHSHEYVETKLQGYIKCEKNGFCYNIGTETSYYINGMLAEKRIVSKDSIFIIKKYTRDGKLMIQTGSGYDYVIETGTKDYPRRDSLVYEIKNSKRQGLFKRYRRYLNTTYYILESGNLMDGKETGTWTLNEIKSGITRITIYEDGKLNGYFYQREDSKNLIETGVMQNNLREGLWVSTDTANHKIQECYYHNGSKIGSFITYFNNGKVKTSGQYIQIKGIEKEIIDLEDGRQEMRNQKVDNKEAMDGVWKYYDEDGSLIFTQNYKKGKLK